MDGKDVQAVGFTLALTKGVSADTIQAYCLDQAFGFGAVGLGPGFLEVAGSFGPHGAFMAEHAASCRVSPRLITIRRAARGRLSVRSAKATGAAARGRARVTCTGQPDGSVAIRVTSAAGTPLRKVVGPRLSRSATADVLAQSMSFFSMRQTAMRQVSRPKATRTPTWARSAHPSQPKTASRTSSTQW